MSHGCLPISRRYCQEAASCQRMQEPCVLVVPLSREGYSEGSTLAHPKGSPPGWERLARVHTGQIRFPSTHGHRHSWPRRYNLRGMCLRQDPLNYIILLNLTKPKLNRRVNVGRQKAKSPSSNIFPGLNVSQSELVESLNSAFARQPWSFEGGSPWSQPSPAPQGLSLEFLTLPACPILFIYPPVTHFISASFWSPRPKA